MNQLIDVLKNKNYLIPKPLIFNYKKMNINDSEFIVLIYLINQDNLVYNPKQISCDLDIEVNNVLEIINALSEKNILKIELKNSNNIRSEVINLDLLFEKLAFSLTEKSDKNNSEDNIYNLFENEFGRTLSPMEYEIINSWINNDYSEEIIKLALMEATYNGVSNLRYIDKIIYEWGKKGIKTKEDVLNNRKQFKNNKSDQKTNTKLFDYDWLNDESNS